jgi:hypothetical protein
VAAEAGDAVNPDPVDQQRVLPALHVAVAVRALAADAVAARGCLAALDAAAAVGVTCLRFMTVGEVRFEVDALGDAELTVADLLAVRQDDAVAAAEAAAAVLTGGGGLGLADEDAAAELTDPRDENGHIASQVINP